MPTWYVYLLFITQYQIHPLYQMHQKHFSGSSLSAGGAEQLFNIQNSDEEDHA